MRCVCRCPVCRYCQTPEPVEENKCFECGVQEVTDCHCKKKKYCSVDFSLNPFIFEQNLWICLICGHIGCGRYVSRHAYKHFEETQHTYAMQLTNHRVWDYAGGTELQLKVEREVHLLGKSVLKLLLSLLSSRGQKTRAVRRMVHKKSRKQHDKEAF